MQQLLEPEDPNDKRRVIRLGSTGMEEALRKLGLTGADGEASAQEPQPESAEEKPPHPESSGVNDELVDQFFDSIMGRLFEGDGALDKDEFDRLLKVAMPINDPPRTKATEEQLRRDRAVRRGEELGGHETAEKYDLHDSPRETTHVGRYGGSAWIDAGGDVLAMWAASSRGGPAFVVIEINGDKVHVPTKVLSEMTNRVISHINGRLPDDSEKWRF